jgi:hypothetical protein
MEGKMRGRSYDSIKLPPCALPGLSLLWLDGVRGPGLVGESLKGPGQGQGTREREGEDGMGERLQGKGMEARVTGKRREPGV